MPSREMSPWQETSALLMLVLSNGVVIAQNFQELASAFFIDVGVYIPTVLATLALIFFGFVVSAKTQSDIDPGLKDSFPVRVCRYRFGQFSRNTAKFGFVLAILSVPLSAATLIDSIQPFPSQIYGFVLDEQTLRPIPDAQVRISDRQGATLAEATFPSDTQGFYIVKSGVTISRDAQLWIDAPS